MKHSFYIDLPQTDKTYLLGDLGVYSFYFETQPELKIFGMIPWITFLEELGRFIFTKIIHDEYGERYTIEEFLKEAYIHG